MPKQIIGDPLVIDGRRLSRSRAVRAGDTVYLTGQVPMVDGHVMTWGTIEDQTRAVLDEITKTLTLAGCTRDDVVKAMVRLPNGPLKHVGDFAISLGLHTDVTAEISVQVVPAAE